MTRTEAHYLNCQDENCERFACVARRDYERQISKLGSDLKDAEERIACGHLVSAGAEGGKFTLKLKPAQEIVQALCAGMAEMVGEANYVECELGPYTATIQRRHRPTPHEKRKEFEENFEALKKACKGVPETLRQSADLLDDDIDGECTDVREMAKKLEEALK